MENGIVEEHHPWMKGFTIATLVAGALVGYVALMTIIAIPGAFDPGSTVAWAIGLTIVAVFMIWGPIWLLKKSHDFTTWGSLDDSQKLLGWMIIFVGFCVGAAFVLVAGAIKSEFSNRN